MCHMIHELGVFFSFYKLESRKHPPPSASHITLQPLVKPLNNNKTPFKMYPRKQCLNWCLPPPPPIQKNRFFWHFLQIHFSCGSAQNRRQRNVPARLKTSSQSASFLGDPDVDDDADVDDDDDVDGDDVDDDDDDDD